MSPRTRPRSKGARRFYLKTLYRSNPPLGLIRIVTIILTVIAVAALLWTAAAQLAVADVIPAGAADFLSDFFTTETAATDDLVDLPMVKASLRRLQKAVDAVDGEARFSDIVHHNTALDQFKQK